MWTLSLHVRALLCASMIPIDIPRVRYIPSWMPGAAARRFAAAHRAGIASMRDDPFDIAKQEMVCAREKWSVVYVDSACIDGFCIDQRKQ